MRGRAAARSARRRAILVSALCATTIRGVRNACYWHGYDASLAAAPNCYEPWLERRACSGMLARRGLRPPGGIEPPPGGADEARSTVQLRSVLGSNPHRSPNDREHLNAQSLRRIFHSRLLPERNAQNGLSSVSRGSPL